MKECQQQRKCKIHRCCIDDQHDELTHVYINHLPRLRGWSLGKLACMVTTPGVVLDPFELGTTPKNSVIALRGLGCVSNHLNNDT